MIKFVLFVSLIVCCSANGGGYGSSGMATGLSMDSTSAGGYGQQTMAMTKGGDSGYGGESRAEVRGEPHQGGPITAAVQTRQSVEVISVPTQNMQIEPQIIEVDSGDTPIILKFNSASSRLVVQQSHTPAEPQEVQQTSSEDEPHRLVHEVRKPIIQEVREVITPYRRVVQEIRPVVEEVHTIVAKGEGRRREQAYGQEKEMIKDSYGKASPISMGGLSGGFKMGSSDYSSGSAIAMQRVDDGYGSAKSARSGSSMGSTGYGSGQSMRSSASTKTYKS